VVSEVSNGHPRRGVPPGIVITLLRAFKTTAFTVGILTGVLGRVAVQKLISKEETPVSSSLLASIVEGLAFLTATLVVVVVVSGVSDGIGIVSWLIRSTSVSTIIELNSQALVTTNSAKGSGRVFAHVFQNHVAVGHVGSIDFISTTTVLGGPLPVKLGLLIERHAVLNGGGFTSGSGGIVKVFIDVW